MFHLGTYRFRFYIIIYLTKKTNSFHLLSFHFHSFHLQDFRQLKIGLLLISFISECHIFLNHFHNISKVNFSSRSLIVWVLQQNVFRFVYFDASSVILQDKIVEWPHEIRTHITNIQIYGGFSRILFQWTILTGMWVCVCVCELK